MTEQEEKDILEKRANLYKEAIGACERYNTLANETDGENRIGVIKSSLNKEDMISYISRNKTNNRYKDIDTENISLKELARLLNSWEPHVEIDMPNIDYGPIYWVPSSFEC